MTANRPLAFVCVYVAVLLLATGCDIGITTRGGRVSNSTNQDLVVEIAGASEPTGDIPVGGSGEWFAADVQCLGTGVALYTPDGELLTTLDERICDGSTGERHAARAGVLTEAVSVVTQGAGLPLAGALTILPALAATGLLDVAARVYERRRAAFYGLRSLLLTLVFAAVVGESRAEGLSRIDPVDLGRLVGLDRAPEVKTVRRRVAELAAAGRADRLWEALARRHVQGHPEALGLFYVDGHVRAYHGRHDVPKHHVARMRIAMPAEKDIWVSDAHGDGVLVWQAPCDRFS